MAQSFYDLWRMTAEEQQELLGSDIGVEVQTIVVELDELSMRYFYNERFAPIIIREYPCPYPPPTTQLFQVVVYSIDDASLNMTWDVNKMSMQTHEARQKILDWLKRTNYFVNLKGFESFCHLFGKFTVDYN